MGSPACFKERKSGDNGEAVGGASQRQSFYLAFSPLGVGSGGLNLSRDVRRCPRVTYNCLSLLPTLE